MRALPAVALLLLSTGCATTNVALLPAEPGSKVGAVAVFDPKTETETGVIDKENTAASVGSGRVRAHPIDPKLYASLTEVLPPPVARFTLYFVEGSTQLVADSELELQKMLAEVGKRSGVEIQITGHTDTVGSVSDNDLLSVKRAQEVRDALVGRGLKLAETRVAGRGERELLVSTGDGVAESRNRRVEISVR